MKRKSKMDEVKKAVMTIQRGPKGQPIKLSKENKLLKEIARKLRGMAEIEFQGSERLFFVHEINEKINGLGHHPSKIMSQMLNKFFLVVRTKDPESYYVFLKPGQGMRLKPILEKTA
jgi:hypothetical protein